MTGESGIKRPAGWQDHPNETSVKGSVGTRWTSTREGGQYTVGEREHVTKVAKVAKQGKKKIRGEIIHVQRTALLCSEEGGHEFRTQCPHSVETDYSNRNTREPSICLEGNS